MALKEVVIYAPCTLLDSGACLVDTAGTNDENATKQVLCAEELEKADTIICLCRKSLSEAKTCIDTLKDEVCS